MLKHFRDALRLSRNKNIKKSQGANRICPWLFFYVFTPLVAYPTI